VADIDRLNAEIDMLQARLSGLTEAIRHISEDLNLETVLQRVVDSARTLTGARYGAITTIDHAGELQDVLFSGISAQEQDALFSYSAGMDLFRYLSALRDPERTDDFVALMDSAGFPGFQPHIAAFLCLQIRGVDGQVGSMFVGKGPDEAEFTHADEEILEVFASQAALTLVNARRYGDEQRSKADLEALVNASPVGVLVADVASMHVVMTNQEVRRIAGVAPEQERFSVASLERLRFRRFDGSEVTLEDLPFVSALTDGKPVHTEEIMVVHPDGSEVLTLASAVPISSREGELESVIVTVQDISPREELERLRAEFLAMVSHELRAPLTSIKGSAATMRSSPIPPDAAEVSQFFRIVEEQADHMRDLINDLLDMTRIEAGTLSVSPEPMDLMSVVEQAKSAFHSSGHQHNVLIQPVQHLPPLWGDRQRIAQVLHNLFSNAAANSSEWSTISVSASLDGAHVAVSVIDEGTGIDPERLPLLFTKFSSSLRSDPGSAEGGYGLGLAICKGIVEAHGGRIWAHSAGHGAGARFTFTVPVLEEPAIAEAALRPADPDVRPAATKVERILAVDDDPQALRFVRNTLAKAGYTPIVTSDPGEAGSLLDAEMPHLVLLDVMLPGTDAFEVIKQVPKLLEVPVILVSGRGDDRLLTRAFELGAADYIVKPFSPTELLARVAAALRRQSQSRHAEPYRTADLIVDFLTHTVTVGGNAVSLTPTEYRLLSELCLNAGRDLSYEQLIEAVWGDGSGGDAGRVRTLVKDLRAKLGDDARNPTYIVTVPNIGYLAAAP